MILYIIVVVVVVNVKVFLFFFCCRESKERKNNFYSMQLILCLGSYFKNDFNKNKVNFGVFKILVK